MKCLLIFVLISICDSSIPTKILSHSLGVDLRREGGDQGGGEGGGGGGGGEDNGGNERLPKSTSVVRNMVSGLVHIDRKSHDPVNDLDDSHVIRSVSRNRFPEMSDGRGIFTQQSKDSILDDRHHPSSFDLGHYRDQFLCGLCLCSYDSHKFVRANCSSRHLCSLPGQLPTKTFRIDFSHNLLTSLDQLVVVKLESLQSLSLRRNKITKFVITKFNGTLEHLDLSLNQLAKLEDGSFSFAPSLTNLSLHGNKLDKIRNGTFRFLNKLRILDLSWNLLRFIESSAFDSLVDLRQLYLNRNDYFGYSWKRLPPAIFAHLTKLKVLHIQGSSNGATFYPIQALQQIESLEQLNIDIVYADEFLGPEILRLKQLTTLEFGPFAMCHHMKIIPHTFFQYVPYIKSLSFVGCLFHNIDTRAYSYIPRLTRLTFSSLRTYSLDQAFEDLVGLKNMTSLRYLHLQHLSGVNTACFTLTRRHVQHLTNLSLTELALIDNNIAFIQTDFIEGLPPTLQKWVLSQNVLTMKGNMWFRLNSMTNLVELDVSNQNFFKYSNVMIPMQGYSHVPLGPKDLSSNNTYNSLLLNETNDLENIIAPIHENNKLCDTRMTHDMNSDDLKEPLFNHPIFPHTLKIVRASLYNFFGEFFFLTKFMHNKVEKILFANSLLTRWGTGNMPSSVTYADLSNNYCQSLNINFFGPNNSLAYISLHSNFLGSEFAIVDGRKYFTHLGRARYLDISMNSIYFIPNYFLKGLSSLITLRMMDNRLQYLNISLSETPQLEMLDLSRNSIGWISRSTRQDLDQLALEHPVTLALLHNPLSCTCGGIDLIEWMAMTRVYLQDKELLQCRDEHGDIQVMGDIHLLHDTLQRRCTDRYSTIISSTICVSLFVFIVVGYYIGKRYRWWFYVKYKKNVWLAKRFGFKPKLLKEQSRKFQYDAYLCYSEEDRDLAIECANKLKSHRLFIPDRDILFGTSEVSGMTSGIINSHKFVIFLTENFKEDLRTGFSDNSMLEYTINMALFEEVSTKRRFLHLMQFADTDDVQIPLYLASVLQDHDRRTTFPMEDAYATPEAIQCSWDSLSTCIGQGNE